MWGPCVAGGVSALRGDALRLLELMYPQLHYFFVEKAKDAKAARAAGPVRPSLPYAMSYFHLLLRCPHTAQCSVACCNTACVLFSVSRFTVLGLEQGLEQVLGASERRAEVNKADAALARDAAVPRSQKVVNVANSRAVVKTGEVLN